MAVVLALLSSLMWGTADFAGGLYTKRRTAMAVVGGSQFAGLVAVGIAAVIVGAYRAPIGWVPWSVGAGLIGATGLVCYYAALSTGTMGVVAPVSSLGVLVPLLVGVLGGESPTVLQYAGIAVAVVGVLAASTSELSGLGGTRSLLLAVVAGLCFGLVFVAIARGSESSAVMTMVGMRATSVTVFLLVACVLRTIGGLTAGSAGPLAVIGVFDVGANLAYAVATTMGFVSIVSVLGSVYPVVTVLLARALIHERLRRPQQVGVAVTFVGVALIVLH